MIKAYYSYYWIKEVFHMSSCCSDKQCDNKIDYSKIHIGNNARIIPYKIKLDLSRSRLNPGPGQNQRFCYSVTGVGFNNSSYQTLLYWILQINPNIKLSQIKNVRVFIGGKRQLVKIGTNVKLYVPPNHDPNTGLSGLEFIFTLNKVCNDPNSKGLFYFELTTPYRVNEVLVGVASTMLASSALAICGPI